LNDGTYSLSGTVVNSETGEPLRNAVVTLAKTPTPQEMSEFQEAMKSGRIPGVRKSALSGTSGEYQFTGLKEGQYMVNAQKPGYVRRFDVEGQQGPIALSASISNITVKLAPLGVIESTVTDQNGEPIDSVKIEAYRRQIVDGARSISSNHSAVCNDRGAFRIWGLDPGQYYLKASGRNGGTYMFLGQGTPRPSSWLSFVPVYAGGARTLDSATPITIAAGTQARADFKLNLAPSATIRGIVENLAPNQRVTFSLRQDGEEPAEDSRVNLSVTTGRFEITAVPPGDYILTAVEGQVARGELPVHVVEGGLSGLTVPLWPAVTVTGTVHNIGPAPGPAQKKPVPDDLEDFDSTPEPGCQVTLRAPDGQRGPGPRDPTAPAGTFSISNIFVGHYRVEFWCTGGYITSATYGTNDLLSNPAITIEPGGTPPPIEIAMRPGGGTIHANIAPSLPNRGGGVLAVPTFSSSTGPRFQPMGIADDSDDQELEISNLAPGDYMLYAFSTADQIEYRNPAVLESLTGGTTVHVDDGKTSEVKLNAVVK
jgi:hypothetical protein